MLFFDREIYLFGIPDSSSRLSLISQTINSLLDSSTFYHSTTPSWLKHLSLLPKKIADLSIFAEPRVQSHFSCVGFLTPKPCVSRSRQSWQPFNSLSIFSNFLP